MESGKTEGVMAAQMKADGQQRGRFAPKKEERPGLLAVRVQARVAGGLIETRTDGRWGFHFQRKEVACHVEG